MAQQIYPVQVEVCVGSVVDVLVASTAGADRVELCGALELGGLTPSAGLVETVIAEGPIPVVVMLRPRAGGFCYDRSEFAAMLCDARRFKSMGAAGIVFGILDQQGCIDAARSRELVEMAAPLPAVFHRAFDCASNLSEALDVLIQIGCARVLSSGGQPTAHAGVARLRDLICQAAGRIDVMPGGGISARDIVPILRVTGCRHVHLGAATVADDGSPISEAKIELHDSRCLQGARFRAVNGDAVAAAIDEVRRAALRS